MNPAVAPRPWSVVLLTALGAWLAAVPLIVAVALLFGDLLRDGAGTYLVGALLLAGAVVVLRSERLPLFVEQLAVPALLVGGGALAIGLFRDAPHAAAAALLAVVALALAMAIPTAWLRTLLGAAAAILAAVAMLPERWFSRDMVLSAWWAWHAVFAAWLAGAVLQRRIEALAPVRTGVAVALLAALAGWSGPSMLAGAAATTVGAFGARSVDSLLPMLGSTLVGLSAAAWLARRWPSLRRPWCLGVLAVAVALCGLLPALGAVLAVLAAAAAARQVPLAGAAALSAAWIVGSFYYRLEAPLTVKALVLVLAGAVLGALAVSALRSDGSATPGSTTTSPWSRAGIALSLVAVLVVANVGIWQKERLIAHGEPVLVALEPVDPRSLMQGDYMRLGFRVPQVGGVPLGRRPLVVARLDDRGVATIEREDDGTPLQPGELRIELTPKDGRWILVTDAWFFEEGEATRWERARFGEFRVMPDGKALLVGLRDGAMKPL